MLTEKELSKLTFAGKPVPFRPAGFGDVLHCWAANRNSDGDQDFFMVYDRGKYTVWFDALHGSRNSSANLSATARTAQDALDELEFQVRRYYLEPMQRYFT